MHHGSSSAARWWATCPLCRRDVHYLLPLHRKNDVECPPTPPPHTVSVSEMTTSAPSMSLGGGGNCKKTFFRCLREKLVSDAFAYLMVVVVVGSSAGALICVTIPPTACSGSSEVKCKQSGRYHPHIGNGGLRVEKPTQHNTGIRLMPRINCSSD